MPDMHSELGASKAHRFLVCTPSAKLEASLPDAPSSQYAEEGTLAHSIAEWKIKKYVMGGKELEGTCPEPSTEEMDRCTDMYKDFVEEELNALRVETPDAMLLTEQRLRFDDYVPDGFGTADAVIVSDETLEVIDFKYGKGVPVNAQDNPQLRLYALGAYLNFSILYDFSKVKTVIFQPRLDAVTSETIKVEDLLDWAENYVKPRALMASKGEGEYVVGEHCRFCKAAAICRARAEEAFKVIDHEQTDPPLLSPDEIPDILDKIPTAEAWIDAVKAYAREQAVHEGVKWRGYKLVEARTQRRITDPLAATNVLLDSGYELEDFTNTKLKGLTDLQKLLGKKKFDEYLGQFIEKPKGEPTLVPESDKRPEYSQVEEVFKEEM